MVASFSSIGDCFFRGNDRGVDFVDAVDEGEVSIQVFDDEDARTRKEDVIPFILQGIEVFRSWKLAGKVVDRYI